MRLASKLVLGLVVAMIYLGIGVGQVAYITERHNHDCASKIEPSVSTAFVWPILDVAILTILAMGGAPNQCPAPEAKT